MLRYEVKLLCNYEKPGSLTDILSIHTGTGCRNPSDRACTTHRIGRWIGIHGHSGNGRPADCRPTPGTDVDLFVLYQLTSRL